MQLTIQREELLKPLQLIIGVVEKRQTLPILANVLFMLEQQQLSMTATDLEVELVGKVDIGQLSHHSQAVTLPGRKLLDICRALPDEAKIEFLPDENKGQIIVRSGRSRFTLSTLPAHDFPNLDENDAVLEFQLSQKDLRFLIQRTAFAIAQQDVRYYLNGLWLEVNEGVLRAVATDGHRLALNTIPMPVVDNSFVQIIIPRKGITELMRLLDDNDTDVQVKISKNHIQIKGLGFIFTSKLVDGRFPDYKTILPKVGEQYILIDRDEFKQALHRVSILSNEKFRGVRLQIRSGSIVIQANNPEQEEAEEIINIDYHGNNVEMGFNVSYLLDVLSTVDPGMIKLSFSGPDTGILLEEAKGDGSSLFVIMPMRL
jgi:DNA polymerase-3 subunit beta